MQPSDVDKLLTDYRTNQARFNHLYIDAMNTALQINAEARKAIAEDAIHAQQYKDSPPSGRISKPVEDLAIRYMDGYVPDVLKGWMEESEAMQTELRELETNIMLVDTWLGALSDSERVIVRANKIDGLKWPDITRKSKDLIGEYRSDRTLRSMCKCAMSKIYNIAR